MTRRQFREQIAACRSVAEVRDLFRVAIGTKKKRESLFWICPACRSSCQPPKRQMCVPCRDIERVREAIDAVGFQALSQRRIAAKFGYDKPTARLRRACRAVGVVN